MFETEKRILTELASQSSCVVAGRTGFMVFSEWPNQLNIFIQASMDDLSENDAVEVIMDYINRTSK